MVNEDKSKQDNDDALWHAILHDVRPLKKNQKSKIKIQTQKEIKKSIPLPEIATLSDDHTKSHAQKLKPAPISLERLVKADEKINFRTKSADPVLYKKLVRGELIPYATLDLHGLTIEAAKKALQQFLRQALIKDWFVVKIIHGKGSKSKEDYPALKNQINYWLRNINFVTAFCSTPVRHGGTGALYVLLHTDAE